MAKQYSSHDGHEHDGMDDENFPRYFSVPLTHHDLHFEFRARISPSSTMLLPTTRLKQSLSRYTSYLNNHCRTLLLIFLILPFSAYIITWILSTTETFFPRPLRDAKEVLIVVAHPDDECMPFEVLM
jgi:hypothetical protein